MHKYHRVLSKSQSKNCDIGKLLDVESIPNELINSLQSSQSVFRSAYTNTDRASSFLFRVCTQFCNRDVFSNS